MSRPEEIIPKLRKDTIISLLSQGRRLDDRRPDEFRELKIEANVIERADGSALVSLGNTMVIAGVKAVLGTPYPDSPNEGAQIVNAELIPLASPVFEPGPPGEEDVELSRVVDRALRSAGAIDLRELAIVPGRRAWCIYIDIYALNHDGNLIDASALAAVAALYTAKIPEVEVRGTEVRVKEERRGLPMRDVPVTVTFAKIGGEIVVDPCYEEELVMDARITFGIDSKGNLCAIQKGLRGTFAYEEVVRAASLARKLSASLREAVIKLRA